ncbi:MAG: cytochrome B6 [Polyangiales bacterium]
MKRHALLLSAGLCAGSVACDQIQDQDQSNRDDATHLSQQVVDAGRTQPIAPITDFSQPPTNAPAPTETCGDPNGGDTHIDFDKLVATKTREKAEAMTRQRALLDVRYDLADKPSSVKMTRGKPVQSGVRAKLPEGVESWEALAALTPEQVRTRNAFPLGFLPLPHPKQNEGGMLFPAFHIKEVEKQTGRDLERFDLEFDLPDAFLPEFPPPIFLTTRPDLGDVSQGQLVTHTNYYDMFKCVLNPKQLDGLRLLVTPFPQAQFNSLDDRRSLQPSLGVTCFDCHANGHSNASTHLVGDIRPQQFRHRIDTPSLRGTNIQRIFGSQRALSSIEDFTEFEQRAAYFDGDPAAATKKGMNPLDRGTQVQHMSEFQKLLDFPPAPKLAVGGKLDPALATEQELKGQELFWGKAKCGDCHSGPYYTDHSMHDLKVERFYTPRLINGMMASADGPIKTFTLRGIKESPPYFHDGRLLTLEDVIEFFNVVLQTKLTVEEKQALHAFLLTL